MKYIRIALLGAAAAMLLFNCAKDGPAGDMTELLLKIAAPPEDPAGSNPPGAEPLPFGKGWFKGGFHSAPTFAPDGKTFWWAGTYGQKTIYTSTYAEGRWTEQEKVIFPGDMHSMLDPFVSPDGKRIYFLSTSPLPGKTGGGKENIWYVERKSKGWGSPVALPESVNRHRLHWTPSVTSDYDLYFSADIGGNSQILMAPYRDGTYGEAELLGPGVNSEGLEFTPQIAPDGSYLLFSRAPDNNSSARLYISYAAGEGWSEAELVDNVETCISPIVTPDRKYIIYLKGPGALEWRDTSFIREVP